MKWFLILWFVPIALITSWYGLSYHDMHFGIFMLTRQVHDMVFQLYGNILGIAPETIPPLLFKAIAVDSLIVLGIAAFRWRKQIAEWIRKQRAPSATEPLMETAYVELPVERDESLSKAP
ncbi:DUF6105 family protein [Hoeflea prorocentri]|uniref:DUF6105 family protein n=1 Tax=Hoeflea prorocentri TaxID=1922333 RepID=A0A9X3UFQ3_9HYPH|nr:DUF6105 family protein [Hoeflea prorocentri]MCY6380493.1 DUF6105 family protein [Hoeflea prorocentri]MDA5398293.1 DUF6105 family protein [Hoeflea prorocentri]